MHRVFVMCLEAGIAAIVLVPLFLILNKRYFHNLNRTIGYLLFALYLAAMDAVVALPSVNYIRFEPNINLVPFAYMFSDYKNSFLNVLLFMPLGFLLPILWTSFRKFHWTLLFGFCTSLLIEVLQLFTFRATDINDLMTNTLGTLLGWCIARLVLRFVPSIHPEQCPRDTVLVCGAAAAVSFFVQPFLAELVWRIFR